MNSRKWVIMAVALGLMGGAAGLLTRMQGKQTLGRPAVKTSPIPGSQRLQVELPERILDCTSEAIPPDKTTLEWLPQDTSFGQRLYTAPDGFQTQVSVVLMGRDRTSIHKTEFCLEGQGWQVDRSASSQTNVSMTQPFPYTLPVAKFIATKDVTVEGQAKTARGVYVLWFVADNNEFTARHTQRMWWMARDMLFTGVLQRWASVSYFACCAPGQEDATFARIQQFIIASAPEFQLVPRKMKAE